MIHLPDGHKGLDEHVGISYIHQMDTRDFNYMWVYDTSLNASFGMDLHVGYSMIHSPDGHLMLYPHMGVGYTHHMDRWDWITVTCGG
jgi:hypothetical protein